MSDIRQRKEDHIGIILAGRARHAHPAGFDDIRFAHNALPEIALDDVDLTARFLGYQLKLPYLASSMTGGPAIAERINVAIAEAAQHLGFAFGVGSQRVSLLAEGDGGLSRRLRACAPDVPILANLGAVQLVNGMGLDHVRRAIDQIGADALVLHLNPLQEAIQPGGDRNWRGVEGAITALARQLELPLIAKEVGAGISKDVAVRLVDCGVAVLDVAGAGGTSWAAVEGQRATDPEGQHLGEIFRDWGIPTCQCLIEVGGALPEIPLIASGGIRHGLDGAKAIRLGASLIGQAGALLPAAVQGTEAVVRHVQQWAAALRISCFATGAATLDALRHAPLQN